MPQFRPLEVRFAEKFIPEPNSGCWLWIGAVNENGYGVIGRPRTSRTMKAHRVSWQLHRGEIGERVNVLHRCDTPACVNPDHLFLGSLSDNSKDCVTKGRNFVPDNRGEKAKWRKLSADAVRDIKTRRMTPQKFADLYGCSRWAVRQVLDGRNWKSLDV